MTALPNILPCILILFLSCNNTNQQNVENTSNKPISKASVETIPIKDTLQLPIETSKKASEKIIAIDSSLPKLSARDSFLLKPFDLYKFKRKVGQSNSGGASALTYRYKPKYRGMYNSFSLFSRLKGYYGNRKQDTIRLEGLRITTYKPYGKYQNDYLDPTEELIEVEAKFNNFDLPELAFVGLRKTEIIKKLGDPSFKKNNCLVYTFRDRALILNMKNDEVKWLKYVHLKFELTSVIENEELYSE